MFQEALRYYELVFDAVYTPKITRLLREAQEMGSKIVTGVEMFIGQAYEQYERFTGLPGKQKPNRSLYLLSKCPRHLAYYYCSPSYYSSEATI